MPPLVALPRQVLNTAFGLTGQFYWGMLIREHSHRSDHTTMALMSDDDAAEE
jgi:hypothetical protein